MASFKIEGFHRMRPRDGAPLFLTCDKKESLILHSVRGFNKKKEELRCDPTQAFLHKIDDGPRSSLTGRRVGTWEVDVLHKGGVTPFRMRNQGDALALISWIEKREKNRPRPAEAAVPPPATSANSFTPNACSSEAEYRAYLTNLCYRLSYLRGRQTAQEVDAELTAIVEELQGALGARQRREHTVQAGCKIAE